MGVDCKSRRDEAAQRLSMVGHLVVDSDVRYLGCWWLVIVYRYVVVNDTSA